MNLSFWAILTCLMSTGLLCLALSTSSSIFTEFVFNTNLYQHVDSPTHKGGNILDLIFSQSPTLVSNVTVRDSQPLLGVTSDHFLISFLISHSASLILRFIPNFTLILLDVISVKWWTTSWILIFLFYRY